MKAPIPILMYHQIDAPPPSGTPLRGMVVSPRAFARQMKLLKLLGYRGLALRELMPYLSGAQRGNVVGITFDDGYRNNLDNALPALHANGFSATCYVVSHALGGTNAWDAQFGVPAKPLMREEDLRAWLDAGMEVGAHSRDHVDLLRCSPEQAHEQIAGCRDDLENALGIEVRHFCYPYGRHNAEHQKLAEAAGYHTATTVQRGRARAGDNLFALPRVLIAQSTHLGHLLLKLKTAYEDKRR